MMALTDRKGTGAPVGIGARLSESWPSLALGAAILVTFIPTVIRLVNGPWSTEQEGHGPIVIAAAGWLAWQAYQKFNPEKLQPAYVAGWLVLLLGLALLVVTRSQDVLMLETAAQIPIIAGAVLLVAGWQGLKAFAFPIGFLLFAVPPPGWMLDIFTVPMKLKVSDWATELLYRLDFPIAQNGVMIMVGPYQLMVKDACSGMNSIFALSAIGFFYVHEFIRNSPVRVAIMLLSIIPITIAANFVRVLALILIAYYFGVDAVEGVFHDLTGFLLFAVALGLFFLLDVILIGIGALFGRLTGKGGSKTVAT
jgi:exosortase B